MQLNLAARARDFDLHHRGVTMHPVIPKFGLFFGLFFGCIGQPILINDSVIFPVPPTVRFRVPEGRNGEEHKVRCVAHETFANRGPGPGQSDG